MVASKSRPKRWAEAIDKAQKALANVEGALDAWEAACDELNEIRQEYEDWKDNLNENLVNSSLGQKLEEVAGLDIESSKDGLRTAYDEANDMISTAEGTDLPMGFGRD